MLARDTRHSIRRLIRDWRFSVAAVLLLGLGIGANTAIFSLVNAVLFRDAPLAESDRLVDIYQIGANPGGMDANSYPFYLDVAPHTDVFASTMAALVPRGVNYQHDNAIRPAVVEHTSATYLAVLGLQPALGRWFTESEDTRGAEVVGVVGHQAWLRKFGSDPSVIGRVIRIEGVPVTIVGVGPAGHNGTINLGIVTDFWLPISSLPALGAPTRVLERRPAESAFWVKARLKDGVSVAQAQAAMNILGRRLASEYPNEDPGRGIRVVASEDVRFHPQADATLLVIASIVLGIVGLVLAVACSNLATLLLVRGASRAKEISVRLAVGANRRHLVGQLLTESLFLSLTGGATGWLLAWWAIQTLRAIDLPVIVDVRLDVTVLIFAIAISLVTGIVCGLAPALKATRIDLVPTLRDESGSYSIGSRRLSLKNALIVFQVAMSVLLLGGASLFLQVLDASRAQRVGYAIDGVVKLETDVRYTGYSAAQARNVFDELQGRIAALPGVQSVALTRGLPMRPTSISVAVEGTMGNRDSVSAGMIWAGPEYFETLRIPLLYGRGFDVRDRADTPRVVVINETMARQYFGSSNAVGRRVRLASDPNAWMEIIGVVADTGTADLLSDLVDPTPHLFYRSYLQSDALPTTIVARTSQDAVGLLSSMQRELRAVDATLPVLTAKTMAQDLDDSLTAPKAVGLCLAALGGLGVLLASIGLYAVVAFAVSRRSREIGIRVALGARNQQVIWSVTHGVAGLVGLGTMVGLILSIVTTLALRAVYTPAPGLSFYRPRVDPVALSIIAIVMMLVAIAAAFAPARRAAMTDPLTAVRHQ